MSWIQDIVSKLFRLGPAVVEPADVAFGTDPAEWAPTKYGEYIALSSAVYACANLRAKSLAGLGIHAYQDGEEITEGPLVDLLHRVNPHWTWSRLIHMTELSLCLWGQCFWVVERGDDGEGVPSEIWWARPDNMRIVPDVNNYLQGFIYEWNNQRVGFKASEVVWLRYPNPLDEFAGLSPLASARLAVDTGHAALRSNYAIFKNGVQLAGIVTPDDKDATWQSDQVKALRDMLENRFKGADKAHRLAVLGQSAKFQAMGVSPRDAQFIELMQWTRGDVAMVYGIPPELIGDNSSATYNNVREAHRGIWNDTLIPEAEMIAAEITEQLLPMFGEDGLSVKWDYSGVNALASDMGEIAEQAKTWAAIGVPLNAILAELAPQFLTYSPEGEGFAWGNQPASIPGTTDVLDAAEGVKYAEYPGLRFIAPQAVRDAARKGLKLYDQGRGGDGLTSQTVREARTIAGRQDVSPDKLRRMRAWFARHESDKKPGWDKPGKETPGYVAWLLWGGDAGRRWAEQMVADMERIEAGRKSVTKAAIALGSPQHKAAYEEFGRRADRLMASFKREVSRLMREQGEVLTARLAEQAAKAVENESDIDAIWDEVLWQTIFADALLDQIQTAAELGAVSTLRDLKVNTALFNLESPEVAAAMRARSQKFAEQINDTTWDQLKTSLLEGIADGESIEQLMPRVSQVMGDRIRSSAETIARTETIGALTEGSLMGAKEAEATGLKVRKQWLATFDGRERASHAEAHERYQANPIALSEPFIVGGASIDSPGNGFDAAEVINCRCAMTYVVEDDTTQAGVLQSDIAAQIQGWLNDSRQG
jgi:HK97 family phage portal protein